MPDKPTQHEQAPQPSAKRHTVLARALRASQTDAEARVWARLRGRRFNGLRFYRQQALGLYIVDFVCSEHRLVVEVDGSQHGEESGVEQDGKRTEWLESRGYKVLRFWDNDVLKDTDAVLEAIRLTLVAGGM